MADECVYTVDKKVGIILVRIAEDCKTLDDVYAVIKGDAALAGPGCVYNIDTREMETA